jgi:hypothetical protein
VTYVCRICGLQFPVTQDHAFAEHIGRCVERNAEVVDAFRPAAFDFGDPELAAFAREEGSVYNRRPGTRRRPR